MKIFAVILALFIFSLSANAFGEVGCIGEKYEITANMDEQSQSSDDDCTAGCSPFHLCQTCSGFTPPFAFIVMKPELNNIPSILTPRTQQFISVFYGNIWQPPKNG